MNENKNLTLEELIEETNELIKEAEALLTEWGF